MISQEGDGLTGRCKISIKNEDGRFRPIIQLMGLARDEETGEAMTMVFSAEFTCPNKDEAVDLVSMLIQVFKQMPSKEVPPRVEELN